MAFLGLFPNKNVIYAAGDQALADESGMKTRDFVNRFGPDLFGIKVSDSSKAKNSWNLVDCATGCPTGGSMECVGVGAGVHGKNAHLLLLDDLFTTIESARNASDREKVWRHYTSSLYTRLTPDGAVISMGTPFHSDDWFGRAAQSEANGGDKWHRVRLPALASPLGDDPLGRQPGEALWPVIIRQGKPVAHFDAAKLEEMRNHFASTGNLRDWKAQFDLVPVTGDGVSEWPKEYFEHVFDALPANAGTPWTSVLSIDVSKGSTAQKRANYQAFSYVEALASGKCRTECHLYRLDTAALLSKAIELYKRYRPKAVVIETNNMGYTLFESLKKTRIDGEMIPAVGRNHGGHENKVNRITQRLGSALASGILHFTDAPHNKIVVDQMRYFPHADFDDGPDSLEMALELVATLRLPAHERKVQYQTQLSVQN